MYFLKIINYFKTLLKPLYHTTLHILAIKMLTLKPQHKNNIPVADERLGIAVKMQKYK